MSQELTLGLRYRVAVPQLRHLLEAAFNSDMVTDVRSVAVGSGLPFSTDPIEHLLDDGVVHLVTANGKGAFLTRGMVLGGFRDWANTRVDMAAPIPASLSQLSPADGREVLAAALTSPADLSDFYQIDLATSEVPLIFLDRNKAHDHFMALFAQHGEKMVTDDWNEENHMVFADEKERGYHLCGRRFDDDYCNRR